MEIIKKNSKSILLVCVITFFNLAIIMAKLTQTGYSPLSLPSIIIYLAFLIITFLFTALLYRAKQKNWKIEKTFLVCGLILGSFYSLAIPIGGIPDEQAHFWRIYQLSEGRIFSEKDSEGNTGSSIPKNMQSVISAHYSVSEHGYASTAERFNEKASDEHIITTIPTGNHPPFNYIPQIIGVWAGRILHLPLIPIMYLSRLFNMIFCIVIIYFCIKYIPIMKKLVFLVAMLPMTMHLFSSVSADGSIICASMALITYFFYARDIMKHQFNYKDFLLLLLICIILTIVKPVYALLCPILFWIPKQRFKSNTHKIIAIILLGTITFAFVLFRLSLETPLQLRTDIDPAFQTEFIFSSPFQFLKILVKDSILFPMPSIDSLVGKNIEWFSVELFTPCVITFMLFFAFLCAEPEAKITRSLRIFTVCSFFAIVLSTFITMFIQWTPPEALAIEGVQGRYFLPIVLLIPLFCLPSKKIEKRSIVKDNYLLIFTTLTNVYAVFMVICSHL